MVFSGHVARKRFAQHWLKDDVVLEKIVAAADLQSHDRVIEVGPGRGALTEKLLASEVASVHAIELDKDLVAGLNQRFGDEPRFRLSQGDVLKVPLTPSHGEAIATKVVANIPYNITGPLLERLVGRLDRPADRPYQRLVLLLQREVADRICALPGQKSFSALSVRIQLLARCSKVCLVSPNCFTPKPKVYSQVIVLQPMKSEQLLEPVLASRVEGLIKVAFCARRKMLRNTLAGVCPFFELDELAKRAGIRLDQRPQEVPPSSWVELARGLNRSNCGS